MADGKVNITFSTVAQLGGLNALSAGVKTGGREFKDFGEAGADGALPGFLVVDEKKFFVCFHRNTF